MRIGIYGGSFNPIHNGHLMLANLAKEKYRLDKILFVPTYITPNKATTKLNFIKSSFRELMLSEALKYSDASWSVCKDELERKGISYTIDTVKALKKTYKRDKLFLICGPDVRSTIHTWKDYDKLQKLIDIKIAGLDFYCPNVQIRSTNIRELIHNKHSIKYLVPESVRMLIRAFKLYQEKTTDEL